MSILEINYRSYYGLSSGEMPIDKLFKAIYLIQDVPGCEEELASLTQKIEEHWENVKEKGGVKIYDANYKYWPNGLCEMSRHNNVKIVLSPWDNKSKFKEKTEMNDYKELKYISSIWSRQFRQQIGRKFNVIERDRIKAKELWETLQKVEVLSEEEKKFVDMKKIELQKNVIGQSFYLWFKTIDLRGWQYYRDYNKTFSGTATFLAPSELMEIKDILDGKISRWSIEYELKDYFEKISKISHVEGRVEIDCGKTKEKSYNVIVDGAAFFDHVYSQILQITDKNVKAVLKRMEII